MNKHFRTEHIEMTWPQVAARADVDLFAGLWRRSVSIQSRLRRH